MKNINKKLHAINFFAILLLFFVLPISALAENSTSSPTDLQKMDSDSDGLNDYDETNIYNSDPNKPDTDGDGFSDGDEIKYNYDPNKNQNDKLEKSIVVALADQSLSYRLGDYIVGGFKISSGLAKTPTPTGQYQVIKKIPTVDYRGLGYSYKNTRWNMMFKTGRGLNYYIHGAYWHNNFGQPMSHGCINVSYENVELLYNWADVGTKVIIK